MIGLFCLVSRFRLLDAGLDLVFAQDTHISAIGDGDRSRDRVGAGGGKGLSAHRVAEEVVARSFGSGGQGVAWLCLHHGVQEERGLNWARRSQGVTHGGRWLLIVSATNRT